MSKGRWKANGHNRDGDYGSRSKTRRRRVGDTVYFTAYHPNTPAVKHICKGTVVRIPGVIKEYLRNGIPIKPPRVVSRYKVEVQEVGTSSVQGKIEKSPRSLVGMRVPKSNNELFDNLPKFMTPNGWVRK